jgi:FkbM family methyltransferase
MIESRKPRLYRVVRLFVWDDHRQITRGGIRYDVDLSEGIDLSLFLFGNFQSHVSGSRYFSLPGDAVIFDVGANIGSMCLSFAKHAPEGVVYAFEPTEYAFNELLRNLALNPDLAARIHSARAYVSNRSAEALPVTVYSSWKVDGLAVKTHPVHGGVSKPAEVTQVVTIDEVCRDQTLERVDFIKIDTDGHELDVLEGARETLRKHRPVVVFEIGDYLLLERGQNYGQFLNLFEPLGYRLINSKNGIQVSLDNYPREVPLQATTDLIALPT